MGLRKSDEEKETIRLAKEAEARQASPVGQAKQAWANGDRYFQAVVKVSETSVGPTGTKTQHSDQSARVIAQIEDVGWDMVNIGYSSVQIDSTTSDRFAKHHSKVLGIYLFSRPN